MTGDQPRSFDHAVLSGLDEYHDLRRAVDNLAQRIDRLQPEEMSRAGFVEMVADLARTSYAADNCEKCNQPCWPIRAEVKGCWMRGTYWCPTCRWRWPCSYTTTSSILP